MRVAISLLVVMGFAALAEASPDSFRPVFGFPYLMGSKNGKGGAKAALETKVLSVTPTRFEFQRACYVFIYDELQKHRSAMSEPSTMKDSLMHNCVDDDKKECGKWADDLVSVLEKKEDEEKHAKHHRQTHHSGVHKSQHPAPHHHGKAEHVEAMPPHEKKNHPHHESALRGVPKTVAKKESTPSEVEHVSGKEFVPKKAAGAAGELKSEIWTPPKRKHHRAALLQGDSHSDRYDAWCDALYVEGGGVISEKARNMKPTSSDVVPGK